MTTADIIDYAAERETCRVKIERLDKEMAGTSWLEDGKIERLTAEKHKLQDRQELCDLREQAEIDERRREEQRQALARHVANRTKALGIAHEEMALAREEAELLKELGELQIKRLKNRALMADYWKWMALGSIPVGLGEVDWVSRNSAKFKAFAEKYLGVVRRWGQVDFGQSPYVGDLDAWVAREAAVYTRLINILEQ